MAQVCDAAQEPPCRHFVALPRPVRTQPPGQGLSFRLADRPRRDPEPACGQHTPSADRTQPCRQAEQPLRQGKLEGSASGAPARSTPVPDPACTPPTAQTVPLVLREFKEHLTHIPGSSQRPACELVSIQYKLLPFQEPGPQGAQTLTSPVNERGPRSLCPGWDPQ